MNRPAGTPSAEGRRKTSPNNGTSEKSAPAPSPPPGPLKPQKKLLIVLSVALALWVAWLIGLYARTVYPMRHGRTPTSEPQEIERQ